MFSLRFTFILLLILFIPFCLRTLFAIEPYPAVLLPAGAGSIKKINEQIVLNYKTLFALDNKGNWVRIETRRFLHPIPIQYLPNLISDNFGFVVDSSRLKSRGFKFLKILHLANEKPKNKYETTQVKNWLKKKLVEQNLNSSKIKFTSYTKTISALNGSTLENKIKYEKIISLDE